MKGYLRPFSRDRVSTWTEACTNCWWSWEASSVYKTSKQPPTHGHCCHFSRVMPDSDDEYLSLGHALGFILSLFEFLIAFQPFNFFNRQRWSIILYDPQNWAIKREGGGKLEYICTYLRNLRKENSLIWHLLPIETYYLKTSKTFFSKLQFSTYALLLTTLSVVVYSSLPI